jgi:molybdopterin-containing oxidoreductase family iron-sulfur binding subunit
MTGRREFLGRAAALALTIAPGVTLYRMANAGGASAKVRWGLLIDAGKCNADCSACVSACNQENGIGPARTEATQAQWIRKVGLRDRSNGRELSLPVMCQHCAAPPCVDVCPTGASFKRVDGIVLVDKHRCIGCRYCMLACPYKARSFVHETLTDQMPYAPRGKGTVESCTLCVHRVDVGGTPACVEACDGTGQGALLFGDLNDPASEISKRLRAYPSTAIRGDLGLDPGVRYQGL